MGSFNVVFVHKVKEIVRKLAYCKGFVSSRSFAVSPCIQGIYLILFSKHVQLVFKIGAVFSIAMKQNDRIPLSLFNIEMFDIHSVSNLVNYFIISPSENTTTSKVGDRKSIYIWFQIKLDSVYNMAGDIYAMRCASMMIAGAVGTGTVPLHKRGKTA